jgi:hypothetical protein
LESAALVAVMTQFPTLSVIVIDAPPSTLLQGPVKAKLTAPIPPPPDVPSKKVALIAALAGAFVMDNVG